MPNFLFPLTILVVFKELKCIFQNNLVFMIIILQIIFEFLWVNIQSVRLLLETGNIKSLDTVFCSRYAKDALKTR